ncbi:MAG: CBS domain-containing protein [Candidatus Natronoplasma sp.]
MASGVWKTIARKGIGRVPVLNNGELVGIVTKWDLIQPFQVLKELRKYGESE